MIKNKTNVQRLKTRKLPKWLLSKIRPQLSGGLASFVDTHPVKEEMSSIIPFIKIIYIFPSKYYYLFLCLREGSFYVLRNRHSRTVQIRFRYVLF